MNTNHLQEIPSLITRNKLLGPKLKNQNLSSIIIDSVMLMRFLTSIVAPVGVFHGSLWQCLVNSCISLQHTWLTGCYKNVVQLLLLALPSKW